MKDLVRIWDRVAGRRYSAVNTGDVELRQDLNLESNQSECEGLTRLEEIDFSDRKDEIINRLFERRRNGQFARQPKNLFLLLMLGFFALGTGFFILFLHPYDFLFKLKVVMSDGGEIFEMWRKPEVDLYVRIFLFNITNPDEFMAGVDDKIKVEEIGPYVYKEDLEHSNVTFNENGTLSAIPRHPLTWVEELSEGRKEDDLLYLPNIALLSIANVVSKQNFITRLGLNSLITMTNSQPIIKMTAKEFMMGYKSNLHSLGHDFFPGWIYFDKLGLIDRMYDFNGDYETIYTGETDVTLSGLIDTYKGSPDLPQWEGKHCSNVQNASDGTKFRSGVSFNDSVLFYRKSLCRAANLVPVKEGVKGDLRAYLYTFEDNLLDNGKYREENKCFCRKGRCLPAGLVDVTDCYYGFPIALSYPHFYMGDEELNKKVIGMTPDRELHETRFWIQPESGLPLDVSSKFQINMALEDLSQIKNSGKFSNMYLPMLWFDIRMYSLPPALNERFKLYLNVLPTVETVGMYLLFVTGTILILITIYKLTFKIMFKQVKKGNRNIVLNTSMWVKGKEEIYSPCEIPIDSESDEPEKPSFIRSHSDRIKELSQKLSDRVYDSVETVTEKVREFTHVKNIFEDRRDSLIKPNGDANNASDSSDTHSGTEDEDCKYLEVMDDDVDYGVTVTRVNRLDSVDSQRILEFSD